MGSGSEPISDDELLYRRVPIRWYDPATGRPLDEAFAPHKENDLTGVSVTRANYKSIEQAAMGMPGKRYYVATLRAGDLRGRGIEVVPRSRSDDLGHSELPDLNAGNRKTDRTLELQKVLTKLCLRVDGPFPKLSSDPRQLDVIPKPAVPPATGDNVRRSNSRFLLWALIFCVAFVLFFVFPIGRGCK